MTEQVGVSVMKTTLSTAGLISGTVGLFCPPAAIPLAIIGLVLAIVGVGNHIYSEFIPRGDILDNEKPMLYSRMVKTLKHACIAIKTAFTKNVARL